MAIEAVFDFANIPSGTTISRDGKTKIAKRAIMAPPLFKDWRALESSATPEERS
jgi:hypothetical protein